MNRYRETLQDNRRHLLEQFRFRDVARKVVGVGSVGLRAYIVLMEGRGNIDPLVLQVKEATSSVLTPYMGRSGFERHGQRIVVGQRLMQAASDPFLGWARSRNGTSTCANSVITRGLRIGPRKRCCTSQRVQPSAAPLPVPTPVPSIRRCFAAMWGGATV